MLQVDASYHDDAGHFAIRSGPVTVDPDNLRGPFRTRRVYVIYGTKPDVVRGRHAHRNLIQLATCAQGSCVFDLDDGKEQMSVTLDHPAKGVVIGNRVWREMRDFSPDCVLVVLASELYDPEDYIWDREEISRA